MVVTIPESFIKSKLDLPRAVLLQIKETHLCNELIDQALADIDDLLNEIKQ